MRAEIELDCECHQGCYKYDQQETSSLADSAPGEILQAERQQQKRQRQCHTEIEAPEPNEFGNYHVSEARRGVREGKCTQIIDGVHLAHDLVMILRLRRGGLPEKEWRHGVGLAFY